MLFSRNRAISNRSGRVAGVALFALLAIAYPLLVYVGRDYVPFYVFVVAACMALLMRAALSSSNTRTMFRLPLLIAAVAIGALAVIDPAIATKAYPAVLSGIIAGTFANSLRHPPSLIERFARFREPHLTPAGERYCRRVTWAWAGWLAANASIAAVLALWGSIGLWALWTGAISYVVTGVLFGGEVILRPWLLRRTAPGPNA